MPLSQRSKLLPAVIGLMLWAGYAGSAVSIARADDYLDALQEAAGEVHVDPASAVGNVPSLPVGAAAGAVEGESFVARGDMPAGLDLNGLESFLKQGYVGSYAFYKRLSDEQKRAVFSAYERRPEIHFIREQIKQQYLSR